MGLAVGVLLARGEPVADLARRLGGTVDDAARARRVTHVAAPSDDGADTDLLVLTLPRHLAAALGATGTILCAEELASRVPEGRRWIHSHPMWVVAQLLGEVSADGSQPAGEAGVHPEADVSPSAVIGTGAVVMKGATIGNDCAIGNNCVVYPRVRLGARVVVGPLSVLGRPGFGWTPSPDGQLVRVPQLGGVEVGDDVEIGPLCSVDAGTLAPTRIGAGAKLDAQVHVGHNVQIGAGTLVAGQAGFAGSAVIGEGVLVGGQSGVTDHARVGAGARVAAHSGVIGDIAPRATVAGFPAVDRMRWLRAMARLLKLGGRRRD